MNKYLSNAFSLQMLKGDCTVKVKEVNFEEVLNDNPMSCIGHQDTANVLGVPMNRVNISLNKEDILYVAQLQGGRLPEGATTLPEGFSFKFYKIELL